MANATLKPSTNRQYILSAEIAFNYTHVNDTGVAVTAVKLPVGAVVVGGAVVVDTAFNTATSAVLDVGDATSGNRYLNDVNLKTAGQTNLVPTGLSSDGADILITPTLVGAAATAGAARLRVDYVIQGRGHEVQPH